MNEETPSYLRPSAVRLFLCFSVVKSMRGKLGKTLYDLSALVVCLMFLVPVLWALFSAFRLSRDLFAFPPNFDLHGFTLENFQAVFASGNIPRYALNSFIVAALSSLLTVLASSMAGFALAKYRFPGRRLILFLILSILLVPLQVLMVPVFLILKTFGWINQLIGIIIPPAATPTGTFMMRQYILGIPDEMIEAARMDGASDWRIYWHIILPLCAPISAALGIISFTWRWNDYLWPLIVVNNQDTFTLQLSLANLVGTNTVEWGTLLAYAALVMLPVLIVFLMFQRYFLKGSINASVKG
jgi:alpha-1,4-digalacturonate transport system permease protein